MNRVEYINSPLSIKKELSIFFDVADRLVIFDIGACEGEDSVRYKLLFKNAVVYAFEPLPRNIELMKKTFAQFGLDGQIRFYQLALSDENGETNFFVSSGTPPNRKESDDWEYGNKSSSLYPPSELMSDKASWLKFNEVIPVKTLRLDNFLANERLDRVDFLHIDVQGAEMLVLSGAGSGLKKAKAVWLEVENVELYKGQALKKDIEQFMKEHGFIKLMDTVGEVDGDQFYLNVSNPNFALIVKLTRYYINKLIFASFSLIQRVFAFIARKVRL
jgi:FkbM family methyltransferase